MESSDRTLDGSQPDWNLIGHPTPPEGAPNVLLVLIDDAGFGNPSTFGGPIQTPNYTRIAEGGLRYNRFHVTALCSPTRAALLTGRNNHAVGYGSIGEFAGGFPGYSAILPRDCAPLPRILRDNGYSTAAFGKWHLTPDGQQGPAGPFDRWPNGWGFDYFYGILGGGSSQWDPVLAENQKIIGTDPRFYDDEDPYYFPDAMADRTIEWLHGVRAQDAHKPFFVYFSTGCSHAPHHVAKEWADKYKGKFDQGWDKLREETFARQKELGVIPADAELTPRDAAFPAWDDVSDKLKAFYRAPDGGLRGVLRERRPQRRPRDRRDRGAGRARQHADPVDLGRQRRQHGRHGHRLVQRADHAERHPADRRDAAAARPSSTAGWTSGARRSWIPTTPPRGRGPGTRRSSGASRSARTSAGPATRWSCTGPIASTTRAGCVPSSPTSSTSRPTILDVAGIPVPESVDGIEQEPMHGSTFAASLTDAGASEHRTQQYFETVGNRGMYKDGWWLAMKTERIPWVLTPEALAPYAPGVWDPDAGPAELYYLPDDFTQAHDLAAEHPEKVAELKELFWEEAERYKVLPLLATLSTFFGILPPISEETTFEFRGDVQNVMPGMIPRIYNRSYAITADLVVPEGGAEGVIVAEADHLGGFTLYVKDGKLTHTYSMMGVLVFTQVAEEDLPTGDVTVRMEFAADGATPATGGEVTLFIDDRPVGKGRMDHTVPVRFSGYAGMDIGRDNGGVVDLAYEDKKPFAFTGTVKKVTFDIKPHLSDQDAINLHAAAHHGDAAHALSG